MLVTSPRGMSMLLKLCSPRLRIEVYVTRTLLARYIPPLRYDSAETNVYTSKYKESSGVHRRRGADKCPRQDGPEPAEGRAPGACV